MDPIAELYAELHMPDELDAGWDPAHFAETARHMDKVRQALDLRASAASLFHRIGAGPKPDSAPTQMPGLPPAELLASWSDGTGAIPRWAKALATVADESTGRAERRAAQAELADLEQAARAEHAQALEAFQRDWAPTPVEATPEPAPAGPRKVSYHA